MKRLQFRDKLVGQKSTADQLVKKLKTLSTELAQIEQDAVDKDSLNNVRKDLISTSILLHKDRGVKAFAACCLADLLRLYAPDAPYTQSQLRDIFQFFFRQLQSGLKPDSSYFNEYFHLLESLSTVKSVVLICDLPNADELLIEIFRDFFAIVRRADLSRKIETYMADILSALIDECATLPQNVLELIIAQFMDTHSQASFRLAVTICNETATKLQRHVAVYFAELLTSQDDDEENEEFTEIKKAHRLLLRIYTHVPQILHTILPQFESQLTSSSPQLRILATESFSSLLSTPHGGSTLPTQFPSVYSTWLSRRTDKSTLVRTKFIDSLAPLVTIIPTISEILSQKLIDPDSTVRQHTCRLFAGFDYESISRHITKQTLVDLGDRGADRKPSVRQEALKAIGKVFDNAYPEMSNNNPAAIEKCSWIPHAILSKSSISQEMRSEIQAVLMDYILPFPENGGDEEKEARSWTMRLLNIMKYLDDKTVKVLLSLSNLSTTRPTPYQTFISLASTSPEDPKIPRLIAFISTSFTSSVAAKSALEEFVKGQDQRSLKLLEKAMTLTSTVFTISKSISEFTKRIEKDNELDDSAKETMDVFVKRAVLGIINVSSISPLLDKISSGGFDVAGSNKRLSTASVAHANLEITHAETVLTFVAKHCPGLYAPHIPKLLSVLEDALRRGGDEKIKERVKRVSLRALASVTKVDQKSLDDLDEESTSTLATLSLSTRIPKSLSLSQASAKHATRLLIFSSSTSLGSGFGSSLQREDASKDLLDNLLPAISIAPPQNLVGLLSALLELTRWMPEVVEERSEEVVTFLTKSVLLKPSPDDDFDMDENADDEEEWAEDDDLTSFLICKLLAIKVLRWRCIALAKAQSHSSSGVNALEVATPLLKMLMALIDNSGSFSADDPRRRPKEMSRLRLQAGISILHLSTVEVYASAITPRFANVALMVQDTCFNVRLLFLVKLLSLLTPRKLAPRFNVIPFLTILDPEDEIKTFARSFVTSALKRAPPELRYSYFEMPFIRLLHLLAHHPDFDTSKEQVVDLAKYINFYLDMVMTADNISLLYHLAAKGKTVRDAESEDSENFYVMCEMAQTLLHIRAEQTHGLTIPVYPGKVKLPSDILRPMPNPAASNETAKTIYLPEEAVSWLKEMYKPPKPQPEKKERKPPVKRKAPPTNGHATKRRKKRKPTDDDDESAGEPSPSETDDFEMAAPDEEPAEEFAEEANGEEPKLGRGAKRRAKVKAKKQVTKPRPRPTGRKMSPSLSPLSSEAG